MTTTRIPKPCGRHFDFRGKPRPSSETRVLDPNPFVESGFRPQEGFLPPVSGGTGNGREESGIF